MQGREAAGAVSIRADGACAIAAPYWCCGMPGDSGKITGPPPCDCGCHVWEIVPPEPACDHVAGVYLPGGLFLCFGCDEAPAELPAREVAA